MSGSSLPTPWSVRPLRSVLSSLRWISLALCTTLLVLNAPSIARSQGLFLPTSSESSHSNISWWETNKSYTCGRLSCSDVILYGNITPSLTIAANPITEDEQTISLQSRAGLIQEAFFALFQRTRTYRVENPPPQPLELPEDNLLSDDPERLLHPYTPKIAVGIENQQVVVFVDQQKGFARQTLATVTRIDAIHNGTTTEELAKKWRDLMRRQLSDLLWGSEYDDRNPTARFQSRTGCDLYDLVATLAVSMAEKARASDTSRATPAQKLGETRQSRRRTHRKPRCCFTTAIAAERLSQTDRSTRSSNSDLTSLVRSISKTGSIEANSPVTAT